MGKRENVRTVKTMCSFSCFCCPVSPPTYELLCGSPHVFGYGGKALKGSLTRTRQAFSEKDDVREPLSSNKTASTSQSDSFCITHRKNLAVKAGRAGGQSFHMQTMEQKGTTFGSEWDGQQTVNPDTERHSA